MAKKVIHLSSCNTCQKIIQEVAVGPEFEYQDVKRDKITEDQLNYFKSLAGSYEVLFNRTSRKYRELGLHEKQLEENDYKTLMLQEYTLLKRPIFVIEEDIFIGNSKKNIEAVMKKLSQ
jgi:arsenate reductase (glutaredoxin)